MLYEDQVQFVDSITQQAHSAVNLRNCIDRIKTLFQFDMDQEDSWYILTPGTVQQDRPTVFGPKDVHPWQFICFLDPKKQECTRKANSAVFAELI